MILLGQLCLKHGRWLKFSRTIAANYGHAPGISIPAGLQGVPSIPKTASLKKNWLEKGKHDVNVEAWREKSLEEILALGKKAGCDAHELYWLETMKKRCDTYPHGHWSEVHGWSGFRQHHPADLYRTYNPESGKGDLWGLPIAGQGHYYSEASTYPVPDCDYYTYDEMDDKMRALIEKEKGGWDLLSTDEMRVLYRTHFRRTVQEVTNENKGHNFMTFCITLSLGFLMILFMEVTFHMIGGDLSFKHTRDFKDWNHMANIRNRVDVLSGQASIFDFENNTWMPRSAYGRYNGLKTRHPYVLYPDMPHFDRYHDQRMFLDYRNHYRQAVEDGVLSPEVLDIVDRDTAITGFTTPV